MKNDDANRETTMQTTSHWLVSENAEAAFSIIGLLIFVTGVILQLLAL